MTCNWAGRGKGASPNRGTLSVSILLFLSQSKSALPRFLLLAASACLSKDQYLAAECRTISCVCCATLSYGWICVARCDEVSRQHELRQSLMSLSLGLPQPNPSHLSQALGENSVNSFRYASSQISFSKATDPLQTLSKQFSHSYIYCIFS